MRYIYKLLWSWYRLLHTTHPQSVLRATEMGYDPAIMKLRDGPFRWRIGSQTGDNFGYVVTLRPLRPHCPCNDQFYNRNVMCKHVLLALAVGS